MLATAEPPGSGDRLHQTATGGRVVVIVVAGIGLEQGEETEAEDPQEGRQQQGILGGASDLDQFTHGGT